MSRANAKAFSQLGVSRETFAPFVRFLNEANKRQNLIATSTEDSVWSRHILDSAQLLRFAPDTGNWIDLGSGAGFPGLITGTLRAQATTLLVEQRTLRVGFLRQAIDILGASDRISISQGRAENIPAAAFAIISARAFAPLGRLLEIGSRFACPDTRWILPKGKNARAELEAVRSSWQGEFRVEPSVTDPEAGIIVADGVRRRAVRGPKR